MRRLLLLVCIVLLLTSVPGQAQTLRLPNIWLLQTGDDAARSKVSFDDHAWRKVWVPSPWEQEGFPDYDGIAWYRVHFDVPPSALRQPLYLELGKVDDADQTWLNGGRIGATGDFPPGKPTTWNQVRLYRIPPDLLHEHNVLAVRVYDAGGAGGIRSGPLGILDAATARREMHPKPGPRASWHQLVTSNGLIAAVYDSDSNAIVSMLPHIFQSYSPDRPVLPVLRHLAPAGSDGPAQACYVEHSHVIEVRSGDVSVDYFAPFTTEEKVLYAVVRGPRAKVAAWRYRWSPGTGHVLTANHTFARRGGTAERYFLFGFTDANHHDRNVVSKALARLVAGHGSLLHDELAFMRHVQARCQIPPGLTADERAVLLQQVSVLKMAQVGPREIFPHAAVRFSPRCRPASGTSPGCGTATTVPWPSTGWGSTTKPAAC